MIPLWSKNPLSVRAGRKKVQVSFMVGQLLGMRPDWAEDAGDALAVAICHLNRCRFMAAVEADRSTEITATPSTPEGRQAYMNSL